MKYLLLSILFLVGCSSWTKQVKVIHTTGEAEIKTIQINDGDAVVCDKNGCRVVNK